jgi:hypothetical protein
MLTSADPDIAATGRLVATGLADTIRDFVEAEEDVGHAGPQTMLVVVSTVAQLLGLMAGRRTRPPFDERTRQWAAENMARIFEDGVIKGIEVGASKGDWRV